MTSKCKLCTKTLRDTGLRQDRPFSETIVFDANNLKGLGDFLSSLDVPARYVCPSCGDTYCCDCLADQNVELPPGQLAKLMCPKCNVRVRLG